MTRLIGPDELADVVAPITVGLLAGPIAGRGAELLQRVRGLDIVDLASAEPGFTGSAGQVLRLVAAADRPCVLRIVGLGEEPSTADLRRAAMRCPADATSVSLLALESPDAAAVGSVVEGHLLGGWRYAEEAGPDLALVVDDPAAAEAAARADRIAVATNWVRRLVEMPPNLLTPEEFAARIRRFAAEQAPGLVEFAEWDARALAERGFGGTLGVAAAQPSGARVVELRAAGAPGAPRTALAGKGITFDAGGIDLKRDPTEIAWMKSDMAAAAAVAAAVVTAAALGSTRSIHAVLPITENMPGSRAQRPGDVVTHPDGRRTEVVDTDSEGRLVLADAIAWLAATGPDEIVDVGTLTDSGALGTGYWGCWSTSAELAGALVAAGERSGDPGWLLPLHDAYAELLESRVADAANAPSDAPDTGVVAATFLRPFAADVPWAHIDNGSGAWLERPSGEWPAGPTGTPVRALIEYLTSSINSVY